jgi:GMP synthase (glutamine-hydrolysing)
VETHTPLLGICYGHQLLARAAGGQVGFHPSGKEIGTVQIRLLPDSADDALFMTVPQSFRAHVTHSQTVLRLPSEAVRLAANGHEPNHAFRIGDSAWGVQFHPEYDTGIMRSYIMEQSDELTPMCVDIPGLLGSVVETPAAARTLKNFMRIVEKRLAAMTGTDKSPDHV